MIPSSLEVLVHEVIQFFTFQLLLLLHHVPGGGHRLLLVHLESSRWLSLRSLLLKSIIFNNILHEFVRRLFIELLREGAHVLNSVGSHALVAGSEVGLITIGLVIPELNVLAVLFTFTFRGVGIRATIGRLAFGVSTLLGTTLDELKVIIVVPAKFLS